MRPSWRPWREIFSCKAKSPCWRPWNGLRPWFRAQRDREMHSLREDSSVIRCMNFPTMSGALVPGRSGRPWRRLAWLVSFDQLLVADRVAGDGELEYSQEDQAAAA